MLVQRVQHQGRFREHLQEARTAVHPQEVVHPQVPGHLLVCIERGIHRGHAVGFHLLHLLHDDDHQRGVQVCQVGLQYGQAGEDGLSKGWLSYRAVVTIITNAHSPIVMIVRLLIEVPVFKKAVSSQNLMEVIYGMSGVTFSMISINMYLD